MTTNPQRVLQIKQQENIIINYSLSGNPLGVSYQIMND